MKKILIAILLIFTTATAVYAKVGVYGNPVPIVINKTRNDPVLIKLYDINNSVFSSAQIDAITKVEVKYIPSNGAGSESTDSVACADCFDTDTWAEWGEISVDLGPVAFTAGRDREAELIIYTAEYTAGRVVGLLDIKISEDAIRDATMIDPLVTVIALNDLSDVDTSGSTDGQVLTKQADNTFAFETPATGDGTGDMVEENYNTEAEFENRLFEITTPGELDYFTNADETDPTVDSSAEIQAIIGAEIYQPYSANMDTDYTDDLALGELSTTAYRGDRGKTAYDHSQAAHAPAGAEENPALMSQAEAEAGTDENERVVSALRIAQAIAAQAGSGSGDVSASSNLTNDAIVTGDGGAKGVQTKPVTISDLGVIAVNGEYTLPNTDGTNGQVLKTDGSGAVTFQADDTGINRVELTGSATLDADDLANSILSNYAQSAEATYVLPSAATVYALDKRSSTIIFTSTQTVHFDPLAGEAIYLNGELLSPGDKVTWTPAIDDRAVIDTIRTGASTYYYSITDVRGSGADGN